MKVSLKKGTLMKHPFWIVNNTFVLILFLTAIFIFLSRPTISRRVPLEPEEIHPIKQEIAKIDLSKIYTNDLFDTFKQPLPPIVQPEYGKPMPPPPTPKLPPMPPKQPLKFLEPLKITLRGIIVGSDERLNRAIIESTQEAKAKNYKVGDAIEDAQLIRILKNKIILIRSNGQQETLYIAQHDAELEQLLMPDNTWTSIIKKTGDTAYSIDPDLFAERIHTLAQFIDVLNITTVYRQGTNVGCRVGKLDKNSLGLALGLLTGDIIEHINNTPITTTASRFDVYKKIIAMKPHDTITIGLTRKNQKMTFHYTLEKFETVTPSFIQTGTDAQATAPLPSIGTKSSREIEEEKRKILEQKYRFAPTVEELQKKEKEAMLKMSHKMNRHRGMLTGNP